MYVIYRLTSIVIRKFIPIARLCSLTRSSRIDILNVFSARTGVWGVPGQVAIVLAVSLGHERRNFWQSGYGSLVFFDSLELITEVAIGTLFYRPIFAHFSLKSVEISFYRVKYIRIYSSPNKHNTSARVKSVD